MKIPDGARKKLLLKGVVDLHVHTSPDIRERPLDDIALAEEAVAFNLKAVVIKSHIFSTVERAWLLRRSIRNVGFYGGIVLNKQVGGLNFHAVEAAIALGAKLIWLPTTWAYNDRLLTYGQKDGIKVLDSNGKILPELRKIMALAAERDIALCTGHISPEESLVVAKTAKEIGITKFVVTHPEWATVDMPPDVQKRLADYGAYFERCAKNKPLGSKDYVPVLAENVAAIRSVGFESTIISTDAGQKEYMPWLDSLSSYIEFLHDSGFSQAEIDVMTKANPSKVLGI